MRDLTSHISGWLDLVGSLGGEARTRTAGGVTWAVTDIPWPMFNAAVAGPDARMDAVDEALDELQATGLPWFWFALPQTPAAALDRVMAAGAVAFDEKAPWVEAERTALPAPDPAPGLVIREAIEGQAVREWGLTLQAAYGFPDAGRDSWIAAAMRRDPARPQFRLWTIRADDAPVAVTLGFVADGIVAQFGVAVLESARGRGYGRLVTLVPPSRLEAPIAGHWATPDGERLYTHLGMTVDGWVTRYLGGMAAIPSTAAGGQRRD